MPGTCSGEHPAETATPHSNERRPSEDGSDSDDDWANDLSSTDGSNDDDRTSSIQQPQDEGVPAYTEEGIHRSIAACQFQLDLPGTRGSPGLVAVLTSAKAGYFKLLYQHFRKVEYLNERIQLCQEVTPLLPKDHPKILECLQGEGESLKYLFERRRRAEDLDRAIELFRRVILLEETHNSFFDLGSALALRARDTGSEADLEEAIQLLEQADKRGLEDDITKGAITLRILGCALHARSRSRDDLAEAERAILILRKGLSMVDDPTLRRRALGDLATVLTEHAEVTQDPRLMDEAIALRRESVSLCSEEAYDYWVFLRGLGQTLSLNHNLVGGLELLEEGITVLRQSFNLMPSHDPDRAHFYHIIGSALINHTRYTGNSQSLVEGIALLQQAVGLRPPGHPLRAKSLGNLATALHDRWEDLGDETDLEDAIRLQEEALQLRPPGHPDRYSCLVSIGISLNHKALLTKDVKSAVSAVDINRSVLDLCPKGHAYHATALQNLAVTLGTLWAMARNVQAVYEAIKIQEEVLELRYKGHPMRYGSLSIMTSLLNDAYKITKNIELLEKAIGFEREALSLYPRGNPNRLTALSIMSFSLRAHFSRTGNPTDAIEALKLGNEFLEETETGDPNRYVALSELVRLYSTRGAPYFNLSKAVGLVLEVLDEPLYHPQRLVRRCMVDLLRIQRRLSEGENLAEEDPRRFMLGLYRKTIELLPRVASFGALSERLNALRDFEKLGEQAVAHALALGKDNYAVEVLESSRAVFWSQALRLRSTYDGVPAHMAEELGQLSRRLESGGIADQDDEGMSRSIETSKTEREEVFKFHKPTEVELKRLGRRFEELVTQVRSMPGLERFLLHDVYERLKRAAIKGVVVILVANSSGCHAIVVKSASPFAQHVPLPGASVERVNKLGQEIRESNLKYLRDVRDVGESAERKSRTSKSIHSTAGGILAGIWGSVVAPIIEHLQLRKAIGRERPRVIWCPTGPFTFVPIHAAEISIHPTCWCSDFFVSSYTPTLGTLLKIHSNTRSVPTSSVKTLLVAEPFAPGLPRLPNTIDEIHAVAAHIPAASLLMLAGRSALQPELGATVPAVLEQLPKASVLHLACHGQQDTRDPLQSGFCLRDRKLTIAQLMRSNLEGAILAFLSACETAKGDETQPDQTVHLAASMLFAGFRSVICTMWTMGDADGPAVAKTVYSELFRDGLVDPDVIPYALDDAVRQLRAQGLLPNRWATFIHMGA